MAEKREEYVEKIKRQLDEWNAAIDKLEKRAGELKTEARERYQARVAALRAKRQEIQGKLKRWPAPNSSARTKRRNRRRRSFPAQTRSHRSPRVIVPFDYSSFRRRFFDDFHPLRRTPISLIRCAVVV
jgi:chromosome segregation ATPase